MGYRDTLASRNYKFTATVTAFVQETELRLRALAMQAMEDLINEVQTPVAKGGKMRVDTGFLRASGQVSLTGMPTGPARPDPNRQYPYNEDAAIVLLQGFDIGKTIYFGWSANYAAIREAYDGFLISGVQNWQSIVNNVCERISKQSPANRGK